MLPLKVYVQKSCGACAKFLQLLASSPRLLAQTDIVTIEGNPRALLEMQELGAYKTPTLVVTRNGQRSVYQGPAAVNALIQFA